jgi:hypothetical protein
MLSSGLRQHDNNMEKCDGWDLIVERRPYPQNLDDYVILHGTTMDFRRPVSDLYARIFILDLKIHL